MAAYGLGDNPTLVRLAAIVPGADTGRLGLTPPSAGLYAVSLGLSRLYGDDQEMLLRGLVVYDALYAWCREGHAETHDWRQRVTEAPPLRGSAIDSQRS